MGQNKMCQNTASGIKFKLFLKESNDLDPHDEPANTKYFPVEPLTGDEAKKFYDDILNETSSTRNKNLVLKPKPQIKLSKPAQSKKFKNSDLLWMAQNNDIKNLNIFFSQKQDFDVNIVDDFGWTPLMCASCNGAKDAVVVLLKNGADPYKSDRLGNTAWKLAHQKNQEKVIQVLENYADKPKASDKDHKSELIEPFFCSKCKENFTVNKSKHESSTLHLFNSEFKTQTFYGIPESNKGFQLLLREGWDKEKGLGPNGTGRKFPVKAVLKRDKRGIGAPSDLEKNRCEALYTEKYETKRRRIYKKWKEKDFEKNFRLEFS